MITKLSNLVIKLIQENHIKEARMLLDIINSKTSLAANKKPVAFEEVYKDSTKTIELKNKIDRFAQALSTWNLKYHQFPNIPEWVREHMRDFQYGKQEVFKYLKDVAESRAQSYWGTALEFRTEPNRRQLIGILSDLAGDEPQGNSVIYDKKTN